MSARRYNLPAQIDQQIRPNFRVREFICRCGGHHDHVLICDRLLDFLQAIHNAVGSPVNITSGHRCPNNNHWSVGSMHSFGRAADFTTSRAPDTDAIVAQNLRVPGIIRYTGPSNFVHVDTRDTPWWATTTNGGSTFTAVTNFGGTGARPASGGCCNAGGGGTQPPPGQSPVLGTGTPTNARIREIQQRLNTQYSGGLVVDGIFGNLTRGALLRAHQREIGTGETGIWGPLTHAATPILMLTNPMTQGNRVWVLQAALYCRRYTNTGGLTSVFGQMTETEAKNFQQRNGLGVNGRADPLTMQRLLQYL